MAGRPLAESCDVFISKLCTTAYNTKAFALGCFFFLLLKIKTKYKKPPKQQVSLWSQLVFQPALLEQELTNSSFVH